VRARTRRAAEEPAQLAKEEAIYSGALLRERDVRGREGSAGSPEGELGEPKAGQGVRRPPLAQRGESKCCPSFAAR